MNCFVPNNFIEEQNLFLLPKLSWLLSKRRLAKDISLTSVFKARYPLQRGEKTGESKASIGFLAKIYGIYSIGSFAILLGPELL